MIDAYTGRVVQVMPADPVYSSDLIADAVVAFTGYGLSRTPRDDAASVTAVAPPGDGAKLLEIVKAVVRESEHVDADWNEVDGDSIYPAFAAQMAALRPGLSEPALRALAWRWAYYRFR